MMKILFFLLMMVPVGVFAFKFWLLAQLMYIISFVFFVVFMNTNNFFSGISFVFGLDSFSYGLISLSLLISSYMVISMITSEKLNEFLFLNFFLSIFLLFIFSFLDFMYMYISFEVSLIPLFILILGLGYQPERLVAGLYLFLYTFLVSLPLLGLILYLYYFNGCLFFDYMIYDCNFFLIHFVLIIIFMVKLPMFMVHFWLPKAHVQAPVSGSMILAGLMLKIGGYGLIRVMYMYEFMYINYSYFWYSLSMMGSLMIGVLCLIQGDMKCLIAYSSISHMGMVIMGLMTMSKWGVMGSYLLMLGHGFCSSGLFYLGNLMYERSMSRSFFINKGMIIYMPSCSLMWFIYCLFNMGCPPSINFLSEVYILIGMISFWSFSFFFFFFISFFCACFSYYLYSYTQHGVYHTLYSFSNVNLLEFMCLLMHLVPLFFLPLIMSCLF